MIRFAFDSDRLDALGTDAPVVITYSDLVHDFGAWAKEHVGQSCVLIDRGMGDPTGMATVIDVERGSHKVADIPGWLDAKEKQHMRYLTAYVNRDNLEAADKAIGGRVCWRWVATLDGTLHIPGLPAGKKPALVQFANGDALGLHCDASVVWQPDWHPEPVPGHLAAELAKLHGLVGRDSSISAELDTVYHDLLRHVR